MHRNEPRVVHRVLLPFEPLVSFSSAKFSRPSHAPAPRRLPSSTPLPCRRQRGHTLSPRASNCLAAESAGDQAIDGRRWERCTGVSDSVSMWRPPPRRAGTGACAKGAWYHKLGRRRCDRLLLPVSAERWRGVGAGVRCEACGGRWADDVGIVGQAGCRKRVAKRMAARHSLVSLSSTTRSTPSTPSAPPPSHALRAVAGRTRAGVLICLHARPQVQAEEVRAGMHEVLPGGPHG